MGVSTQFRALTPEIYLDIDRTKVASLGISLDNVNQTLETYLGSLYVNNFNAFGRDWQVNVQAEGNFRERVEDINLLEVRNNPGQMVPLGALGNHRARSADPSRQPLQPLYGSQRQRQYHSPAGAPAKSSMPWIRPTDRR